jgi:hypothetical protein
MMHSHFRCGRTIGRSENIPPHYLRRHSNTCSLNRDVMLCIDQPTERCSLTSRMTRNDSAVGSVQFTTPKLSKAAPFVRMALAFLSSDGGSDANGYNRWAGFELFV